MSDIIAVIFDFDDTLVPDSTSLLLESYGYDVEEFWKEKFRKKLENGYDSALGYLNLIIEDIGKDKKLGLLSNSHLKKFGGTLDNKFFPGLPEFFEELKTITEDEHSDVSIEFYIISGGLQAIIEGSQIVKKYFKGCYGCTFDETGDPPVISSVKRTINYTEKTRYIFEINKGISPKITAKNPYLVNEFVDLKKRRVPFENMIYVGDGLTDIPCFSLLKSFNGTCFGIFNPADTNKSKNALIKFLQPSRVLSMHSPNYTKGSDLNSLIKATVANIYNKIIIKRQLPY